MFLRELCLKLRPHLSCQWPLVPPATRVGKVPHGEDQVGRYSRDLLRHVRNLSGVGGFHSHLNLFNDGLEWLVDIVWHIHARRVGLEVDRGYLVIVRLEVINHHKES